MNTKVQTLPQSVIVALSLKMIINYNKLISFSCFSCGSSLLFELEFRVLFFLGGRETGESREQPCEQGENRQQNQIQTTHGTEPELNPGYIGGRGALSPIRHPYWPMVTVWLSREGTGLKLTLSRF